MDKEALTQLASAVRGEVITAKDKAYDEARRVWNGTIDKQPAVIVRCRGVADVIDAVNFARKHGLGVSVRGGGHHVAGGAVIAGGLVVDLSQMRAVRVDPSTRTARAEGGAQLQDVDHETMAQGLTVPMGVFSETGIAGLTLAGGFGWQSRSRGLTCDNLVSADVVTADGRLLKASAAENADLFWALRGGGWDMGVVTSFEYRTHPAPPEVFFVFTAYPIAEARPVLTRLRGYVQTAPREVGIIAVIWTFPEAEVYPKELWGEQFVAVVGPYIGAAGEGEKVLQPLRALGTPLLDMSSAMPFEMTQHMFDEEYPNGRRYYWRSLYLRELSDAALDAYIDAGLRRASPLTSLDLWVLGGAVADISDSPVQHRQAPYLVGIEANWLHAADDAANIAWARDAGARLAPFSTGGSYLNFEDPDDRQATANAHGEALQRLLAVKRKYDPNNLFRSRKGLLG